jgi:predicted membrane chloride channel (bestrophin family)
VAECLVLPMMRNQAMKSWHSAEQWMLGSMVPALMAVVCIWLPLGPIPTAFAYSTAIAILIAYCLLDHDAPGWEYPQAVGGRARRHGHGPIDLPLDH